MGTHAWHVLDWIKNPWADRTDKIASEVERAADKVGDTNAEVRRATFDHADSVEHVRTTVDAVLDKLERRGVRSDP